MKTAEEIRIQHTKILKAKENAKDKYEREYWSSYAWELWTRLREIAYGEAVDWLDDDED